MAKYVITLEHPDAGSIELKMPTGSFTLSRSKSENDYGGYFWKRKLSDFSVARRHDSAAYDWLLAIENNPSYRCSSITIRLKRASGNTYTTRYTGEFAMNDCKFDLENCSIIVSSNEKNIYSCVDKVKEDEVNILSIADTRTATIVNPLVLLPFVSGGVQMEFSHTPQLIAEGWDSAGVVTYTPLGPTYTIYYRIVAVTECIGGVSVPPPAFLGSDSWMVVDSECNTLQDSTQYTKWAMFPPVYVGIYVMQNLYILEDCDVNAKYVYQFTVSGTCYRVTYGAPVNSEPETTVSFTNGRMLKNVFGKLLENIGACAEASVTYYSKFFGLGPEEVANPITGTKYYFNPLLFQITDIKNSGADEQASVGAMTFKQLMADLYKMFRVVWWFELDEFGTFIFRVEHISEAEGSVGYDLSQLRGFKEYSYDKNSLARRFSFSSSAQRNIDFVGSDIEFAEPCTINQEENFQCEVLVSDLGFVTGYPNDVPNEGFVILSTDPDGYIYATPGAITGLVLPNAPMAWANLHDAFHRHNANSASGEINNTTVTFDSTVRSKKQTINAKNCDLEIDQYELLITELGTGIIQTITTDLKTEDAKIEVRL